MVRRPIIIALAATILALGGYVGWRLRSSTTPPLPLVRSATAGAPESLPPGARQPVAPGDRHAPPLPQIANQIPQVRTFEFTSNGFIEVAHALILVRKADSGMDRILQIAQSSARQAFAARPSLAEVDVSVYRAEDYAGFGGPSPLFTASVPSSRLAEFLAVTAASAGDYDRLWVNPAEPLPPQRHATGETHLGVPEAPPTFAGSPSEVQMQQRLQLQHQRRGPSPGSAVYFHGPPNNRVVALTFDDAVHPMYAPLLLDVLRRGGTQATFFIIGRNAEAYPYFVRDLARGGHEIGNHTYHHVRLTNLPEAVVRDEIQRTNTLIEDLTGRRTRYFRPPGGEYSPLVLTVAQSLGMVTAFWTDDPGDFNNPGGTVLETRTLAHLRPGGIVLLHDSAPETIGILAEFLRDARARGFHLTTLDNQGRK